MPVAHAAYQSYEDFIEGFLLPLQATHPDWVRIDGREKGSNPSALAFLRHEGRLFRVHGDAHIDSLLAPYTAMNQGAVVNSVVIGTSKTGRVKLRPADGAGSEKYFYIYSHGDD